MEGSGRSLTAAEANRAFYAEYADRYEEFEECVLAPCAQAIMRRVLTHAVRALSVSDPRVLDACGGTGNASFLLIEELGVRGTTVVDVSPQMLAVCRARADRDGLTVETVEREIDVHLREEGSGYDLIVFSSALHHLDDYKAVCRDAYDVLAPGGILVSAFDPVRGSRNTSWVRRVDWLVGLLLHSPREFARVLWTRVRRTASDEEAVGRKAELHALTGIDDLGIRRLLEQQGAEILSHERYPHFRLRPTNWIAERLKLASSFHLVARKPRGRNGVDQR